MVCAVAPSTNSNQSFDVEAAIAGLLADPNRASVELPCLLSSEQRKHAKKVVEQYPDVTCESFGLGKERQMHLFKVNAGQGDETPACSPQRVSVKNTFIDDWIDADGVCPANARVVQSMPHNMFAQSLSAEAAGQAISEASANIKEAPATEIAASETQYSFALGAEVVIDGLVKAPSFNGAFGVVQSWDAESGRYNVLLASDAINGQRWAKIRAENLQAAVREVAALSPGAR